ncbi:MAG: HzsA-related protein, partial [Planctomycetota bacterium]
TLAQIVGTVPVEPDGSAHMELPALRSLFFVALDENDRAVKRMHSFVTLQPGETTSCVGCHEQRMGTPHPISTDLAALRRRPSPVEPISDVPQVFDFPRDVQPILDNHCVECHNPDRRDGKVDLTGDKTARYTISYWTMQTRGLVSDGRNQPRGNRPPHSYGSATSRLLTLIDGSHYDAKLSDHEQKMVRLWIETSATYPGTYASLGCGHYPVNLRPAAAGMAQRCNSCHVRQTGADRERRVALRFGGGWDNQFEPLMNLSRPEKSYLLRAPLAKEADGLALCKETVFADTDDPLYGQMLAAIRDAHDRLKEGKRFDMPGFRPNEHYIREMQRFGFLPQDLKPDDPIDVYAVDRAYWDSFHYRP